MRGSRAGGTRRVPGGVLGARLTRRAPGRGSRGSATRDTWPAREHPGSSPGWVLGNTCRTRRASGCGLRVRHSGTGGILGDIRRKSLAGYSGTGVAFGGCRGGVTRGARDALGCFREACGALGASGDTWRIRGLPGIITRGLPEGLASLALGARGLLRKTPKKVPAKASKGALGRASRRLRKDSGHAACSEGIRKGGVLRGGCRRGFRRDLREGLRKGLRRSLRRRVRRGLPEDAKGSSGGFPRGCPRKVPGRVSSKEVAKGSSGRVLRRGLPEDAKGSSGGFPRGAAMTVGSRVGG